MPIIDNFIQDLTEMRDNLNDTIDKTLMNKESDIIQILQKRLYDTGKNGIGNSLREYKPQTKISKKARGQKYDVTTLFDKGDFYSKMFVFSKDAVMQISSTDWKRDKLVKKYGGNIFQLLPEEQEKVVVEYLEPKLKSIIPSYDFTVKLELNG